MYKLANLIKLKQELIKLTELPAISIDIETNLNDIVNVQNNYSTIESSEQLFFNELINKLNQLPQQMLEQVIIENASIVNSLNNFINNLDLQILKIYNDQIYQKKFIAHSLTSEFIPKRSKIPKVIKKELVASLQQNASWKYPTLIVNPIDKRLIDCAVASDPLYITYDPDYDLTHELLDKLIIKFSQTYQRRLRIYKLKKYNFTVLPQEQFSTIVNWNIINKFNFDELKIYLTNLFNLLRPGGVVLANAYLSTTATDGNKFMFFDQIASNILMSICKQIGFNLKISDIKITAIKSTENMPFKYVCWITMYKPGSLSTVKAHQALAEILEK